MSHESDDPSYARDRNGRFAEHSFGAVYAEIKRLDQLREAQKETTIATLRASQIAVDKAEEAQLRVNQTQNEFRGSLKDLGSLMMTRTEAASSSRELRGLIDLVKDDIGNIRSRLDVGPPALGEVVREQDKEIGRKQGSSVTMSQVIGISSAAATVVGVLVAILLQLLPN